MNSLMFDSQVSIKMAKIEGLLNPQFAGLGGARSRLRGAFINTGAASCSIYESGLMVHDCIKDSALYAMDYFALSDIDVSAFARDGKIRRVTDGQSDPAQTEAEYDFWVFNWHFITMAMHMSPDVIKKLPGKKFTVVLELSPGDPLKLVPPGVFDGYIALDPAAPLKDGIFPFPRPLQGSPRRPPPMKRKTPVIGSFGFGTPGKGFEQLIEAVNNEFDQAVVRINVPSGTYIGTDVVHRGDYARHLEAVCKRIAKPGIDVRFTFDFMDADELIDWCEDNDLNCFMYTRCQPGLSATTDQAIMSGRPLATLTNDTFRHIHPYIPPYPVISLREAMETSTPRVYAMQEDWSRTTFNQTFHNMIATFDLKAPGVQKPPPVPQASVAKSRILLAHRDGGEADDPMNFAARVAACLGRTGEFEVVRARCEDLAGVRAQAYHLRPKGVVLLDFDAATQSQLATALRDFAGPKVLLVPQDVAAVLNIPEGDSSWSAVSRRPVVPFFTVQVARQDPQVICLVGFSAASSNLERVLAGVSKEVPRAEIQIEAPEHERAALKRRLEDIRRRTGQTHAEQVSIISLPSKAEDMVNMFAAHSLVLVYNDPARTAELESVSCLAMTTERAVVFTRAAPFPQFAGLETFFEDCALREAIDAGVAAQIRLRHTFGEWRLFADLRSSLAGDSQMLERAPHDAEVVVSKAPVPLRRASGAAGPASAAEILALKGEDFVRAAYRAVLQREPDPEGFKHHLDLLRRGTRRQTILAGLRLSPEGRARAVDFPGLDVVLRRHRMLSARAFGKLAQLWNSGKRGDDAPAASFEDALRQEEQLEFGSLPSGAEASLSGLRQSTATKLSRTIRMRTAPFSVGVQVFLLAGVEGEMDRPAAFLTRLEKALSSGGDLHPVVWSPDSKHFRLATSSEAKQLGLPSREGEPDYDARIILDPLSAGPGAWLLVPDREHALPDEPSLLEMNMILEARRLGLRSAFIFHGAEPLKHVHLAGPVAASYEMYMQALLLADLIMPVSKASEDDLCDFFVQHEFADFIPVIRKAPVPAEIEGEEDASWREYALRVRSLMSDAGDVAASLGAVYLWAGAPGAEDGDPSFAAALSRALGRRGVSVIPVRWSARTVALVPAADFPATAWIDPGERDAPRWLLAPAGFNAADLIHIQSFAQTRGLRIAVILQQATNVQSLSRQQAVFDGLTFADKVLAVSCDQHQAFLRHVLATRAKVPRADHRFRVITHPTELEGRPRALVPKASEPGIVRILVAASHAGADIANMLEAIEGAAGRSMDRMLVTFVGPRAHLSEHAADSRAHASLGLHWEIDASRERMSQLLDQADVVIVPAGVEQDGELNRECYWRALPCLVHRRQGDPSGPCAVGHERVDMQDASALTEAILKLTDPAWRRCLSQEAICHPTRTWDEYARDIAVELATDRLTDGLQRPATEGRADVYARMGNLRRRPKLSICISTYKRAGWVQTNLRNIFEQLPVPVDDLEVLVVDNTSPDNTPEVVQPYLHRPDFRYIRNPKNVGMLGNLAVTAQRARGEHIWILGDDDLTRAGAINKILGLLRERPGLPLIYMNYGYSTEEFPLSITNLQAYLDGYSMLEPPGPDVDATAIAIAAKCENFYTAIYSHVYRRDHALRAYCQDTSGRIFATMLSCIPTAYYVLHYMGDLPAYWIGEPSLVVNSRVSWAEYGPMLDLEHLPASWDLAERAGCPSEEVERRRANRLWLVKMMWRDLFENDAAGNADYIDPPTVLLRLNHLPEMCDHVDELLEVYTRAHAAGHKGAKMPPEVLFAGWR